MGVVLWEGQEMEKWRPSGGLGLITDVSAGPVVLRHHGNRSHGGRECWQALTFVGPLQDMGLREVRGDCGTQEAKKGAVAVVLGQLWTRGARER